jgi:ribose/xylose/arabinose/galactoside ABC-type transport system permease subunit
MALEQDAEQTGVVGPVRKSRATNLATMRKVWPWFFLVLMVLLFTITSKLFNNVDFISFRSVQGILVYATQILLIGLGETLIIIAAGIDLSVHYILGFSAVIAAVIMKAMFAAAQPPALTLALGLGVGVLICIIPGWINGILVAKVKVPAFIATLGMGYAVYGVALLISNGVAVASQPPYLGQLGNGSLLYYWPGHGMTLFNLPPEATVSDLVNIIPLIPNVVVVTLLVTIVIWFILAKTQFGQHLYAIGGNFQAALRAGIPVHKVLIKVYILAAVLGGIGGALWATRFTSGAANAAETTLLMAIAAVVIGGASLFGGEGTVVGTIIGALIVATIQYGLVVLGMPPFWQYLAVGVVVIVAVIVDQFGRTLETS